MSSTEEMSGASAKPEVAEPVESGPSSASHISTTPINSLRVAVEGCGHGTLHAIYAAVETARQIKGWASVDLLIIGGDFQAVRNKHDLNVTAMPQRYRTMADFHEYYSGARTAPYLTIFIGGNHEASNHLFELYYGGWVAPNIYYLGAANVLRLGPVRIAGLSGIWKGYDYRKPHFERLPYNEEELTSIFHVRELNVRKLLSLRTQVDIGLSHDWPKAVEWHGDHEWLFRVKRGFREDAVGGRLGNTAAQQCFDRLRPSHWFSAHLHVKYMAVVDHAAHDGNALAETSARRGHLDTLAEEEHATGGGTTTQRGPQPAQSNLPASTSTQPIGRPGNQTQLAAWHDFAEEDRVALLAEQRQYQERQEHARLGNPPTDEQPAQSYNFQETFKKVTTDDNLKRKIGTVEEEDDTNHPETPQGIPKLDGCASSRESKRIRTSEGSPPPMPSNAGPPQPGYRHPYYPTVFRNPDSIDLDSSSDEEQPDNMTHDNRNCAYTNLRAMTVGAVNEASHLSESQAASSSHTASGTALSMTIRQPQPAPPQAQETAAAEAEKEEKAAPQDSTSIQQEEPASMEPAEGSEAVPEDLRAELAALSSSFTTTEVSPALPFPEAITNTVTNFLALDKCLPNHDFLQLLEISSISDPAKPVQLPLKLEYDPEWLAILRVFAPELSLSGNPAERVPAHRGETFYRAKIIEEEDWVKENVVEKGKLTVPNNFTVTAPVYDAALEVGSEEMPREVTNPQTVVFCRLVGIPCLFEASEEERSGRMEAGPRAASGRFAGRGRGGGGGRGRGGRGGRGDGRGGWGRGRGAGRGRGGGRGGRGRGNW